MTNAWPKDDGMGGWAPQPGVIYREPEVVPEPCCFCGLPVMHVNDGGVAFTATMFPAPTPSGDAMALFCWTEECETEEARVTRDARLWECCDLLLIGDACPECGECWAP